MTVPPPNGAPGPQEHFWGGGFSWRDPEGNVRDVAWAEGSAFDDRGGLRFR